MSHKKSDPAHVAQFRRQWNGIRAGIKFLSEMSAAELDQLALKRGAAAVAALPRKTVKGLTASQRQDLALWIGRGWLEERLAQWEKDLAAHAARRRLE